MAPGGKRLDLFTVGGMEVIMGEQTMNEESSSLYLYLKDDDDDDESKSDCHQRRTESSYFLLKQN